MLAALAAAADPAVEAPAELQTVAEKSGYTETARHADVMALCRELTRRHPDAAYFGELGRSGEDRPIPLLVLADPPVRSAAEAERSGKLVVLALGGIHAGEICGKEALPMLARELLAQPGRPLLKNVVLALVPLYNPDGNERVSPTNRPTQPGPKTGVGRRENAGGLDLNRDFIKLDAPESRALVGFLNAWNPHVFIDAHTTNGSYHRFAITYDGPKNPAGDPRVIEYSKKTFFPEVSAALAARSGGVRHVSR